MAVLEDGCKYELRSDNSVSLNKTVLHVKLTDSSLRAFEEFNKSKHTTEKPIISFEGNQGVIRVPSKSGSDGYRTFSFTRSAAIPGEQKDGSFECIQQTSGSLCSVGTLHQKLTIRANEDVYETTVKKMSLADEESKKARAKEIKPSGPNIGRRVKTVLPNQQDRRRQSSPPLPDQLRSNHKKTPCNAGQRSSLQSIGQLSKSKVAGDRASPFSDGGSSRQSALRLPFRDRVVHLLALKSYKKPELLVKLHRDGVHEKDKNSLMTVLGQVALLNMKDNSYSLHKHVYNDIQSDWPLYTDEEKLQVGRKLRQFQDESPGPGDSPTLNRSMKRLMSSSTDDGHYMRPIKKPRVAHTKKGATASQPLLSPLPKHLEFGEKHHVDPLTDNYPSRYTEIVNVSQRNKYKQDFNKEFTEYRRLYDVVTRRIQKFRELSEKFQKEEEGSHEYENLKGNIYDEYQQLKNDATYVDDRNRCAFLHHKLGHIKKLVQDYDNCQH